MAAIQIDENTPHFNHSKLLEARDRLSDASDDTFLLAMATHGLSDEVDRKAMSRGAYQLYDKLETISALLGDLQENCERPGGNVLPLKGKH